MRFSRRQWLLGTGAQILQRVAQAEPVRARRYTASATVTLLGVPVFSRRGVGEGYARFDTHPSPEGRSVDIEFGAGSFPDKAHGLNKLGFIRESVIESQSGDRAACAYFGFMTTSQEEHFEDAKRSLLPAGDSLTYSVGCGTVTPEGASGRTLRINLPSRYSWRDCTTIARKARAAAGAEPMGDRKPLQDSPVLPATFLYAIRKAMLDPNPHTEDVVIFNGKYFTLRTGKQTDAAMGELLVQRDLATSADRIIRLAGTLQPKSHAERTSFRVWFESGSEHAPPLRFDYQARSFLRLSFESGAPCQVAPLQF